jgi:hypothetical protein
MVCGFIGLQYQTVMALLFSIAPQLFNYCRSQRTQILVSEVCYRNGLGYFCQGLQ